MTDQNAIVVQQGGFISPAADITTALRRYQAVKDFIKGVLREGVDFGIIPGSDKPTLLKPGAEKMCAFFGFEVVPDLVDKVEDWTGKDHDGEPFFYYRYGVSLYRDGRLVARGEGSANSWETKYRYRQGERACPSCGKAAIIKGKVEYGGGWVCFTKKGGCGAKYPDGDTRIESQQVGRIKNPDPADLVNTLQKMSQKRGLVAPVLIATNTSEYFTQDMEDFIDGTFTDAPHPTTADNGHKPEPVTVSEPPELPHPSSMIELDEAKQVKTANGSLFGKLTYQQLYEYVAILQGELKANHLTPEKREQKQYKIDAALTVMHDLKSQPA